MILKSLLVLLIVGELRISRADEGCGPPERLNHTKPIAQTNSKFPVGHKLRYECEPGFARKAGTSSQIVCISNYTWDSKLKLICIAPTPKKTPTTTTTPEYTTSTETSPLPTVAQTTTTPDSSSFGSHSNQVAVVSGSVVAVAVVVTLTIILCVLHSKKILLLPFPNRRPTYHTEPEVAMATQPNTDTHPNSGTPLCEAVISDSDDPPYENRESFY
ncbi:uncharacterized protein LOC134062668 isoform X5 [Sardina pilchardus]|uniref:uncharacterized protein LOC134062668 isoform X5 n=1 Tax=Sardina pilchardus TaxID=27697 RepID=UPI002E13ED97